MAKFVSMGNMSKILDTLKTEFTKKVDAKEGLQLSQESYTTVEKEKLGSLTVTEGVLDAANIPNIAAGKVTGELAAENIPALDASKVTTGTLDAAVLPNIAAEKVTGVLAADNIPNIDAAKVTGVLSIDNIPHAALERCVVVANEEARLALTAEDVQLGDTVKQADGVMYMVVDVEKLGTAEAFEVYAAGSAATAAVAESVAWTGVTGAPEAMKNPTALTIKVDGVEKAVYDGAEAKEINITAADISIAEVSDEEIEEMLAGTYTEA